MREHINAGEVLTVIRNIATDVSSAARALFMLIGSMILPFAIVKFIESIETLVREKKHEIVQQIEKDQLPELKSQINRLKTVKDAFTRVQQ